MFLCVTVGSMKSTASLKPSIYALSCDCHPEEGYSYIGQTSRSIKIRLYHHIYDAHNWEKRQKVADLPVYRWIRKHGSENLVCTVLETVSDSEHLDLRESYWIAYYETFSKGLNLTEGGGGLRGWVASPETRLKMSLSGRGKVITAETRRKMRQSSSGDLSNRATLTESQVLEIKRRMWNGESVTDLARDFHRNKSLMSHISSGYSWGTVPWPIGPRVQPTLRRPKAQGSRNSAAKIREEDVTLIRRRHAEGETARSLAEEYGVLPISIYNLINRKTWAHVE